MRNRKTFVTSLILIGIIILALVFANIYFTQSNNVALSDSEAALVQSVGFDSEVAKIMKKESGSELYEFRSVQNQLLPVLVVEVSSKQGLNIFNELSEKLITKGYDVFFLQIQNEAIEGAVDTIGVFKKTDDDFEPIRILGTNGSESGVTTEEIIAKLSGLMKKYHYEIYGIGDSWVAIIYSSDQTQNVDELAAEVKAFAPDIIPDTYPTEEDLKKDISSGYTMFNWK